MDTPNIPRRSPMIEHVARTLAAHETRCAQQVADTNWCAWIEPARAAIKEMRDNVTENMLKAGWDASIQASGKWRDITDGKAVYREIFQAMIDAALKD